MSVWTLIQIAFDLICFAGLVIMAFRLRRPPQDDPRLSRGLQLLQTKITILEDLSDRTDNQFKQLNAMLEQKTRQLQNKILEAEQEIMKIDHSMNKSLEVAEIFQDKIPHEEILERQRTIEYVKAARMAHSGMAVEDIVEKVSLPRDQVELIAKFNREQLMFDESELPDWAKKGAADVAGGPSFSLDGVDFVQSLETQPTDLSNMQRLGQEFKQAVQSAKEAAEQSQRGLAMPNIQMPNISMPNIQMPNISMPNISMPNIQMPNISMPNIQMPNIPLPQIDTTAAREFMAPAVQGLKSTAETIKQKLVSTAEDILQGPSSSFEGERASEPSGETGPVALSRGGDTGGDEKGGTLGPTALGLGGARSGEELKVTGPQHIVRSATGLGGQVRKDPIVKKVIFPRIQDPKV